MLRAPSRQSSSSLSCVFIFALLGDPCLHLHLILPWASRRTCLLVLAAAYRPHLHLILIFPPLRRGT
jgi:hypothetical protein